MVGSGYEKVILYGVIGFGSYVVYKMARAGSLGPGPAQAAGSLSNAVFGPAGPAPTVPTGYATGNGGVITGGPVQGGGAGYQPVQPAAARSAMIPGVQYVAPFPGGGFVVVIGGQQKGVYDTQTQAEQAYNRFLGL